MHIIMLCDVLRLNESMKFKKTIFAASRHVPWAPINTPKDAFAAETHFVVYLEPRGTCLVAANVVLFLCTVR